MSANTDTPAAVAAENDRLRKAWQQAWAERNVARDRITEALAIHAPSDNGKRCTGCGYDYPCLTVRALGGVA